MRKGLFFFVNFTGIRDPHNQQGITQTVSILEGRLPSALVTSVTIASLP
jgi:hypothetical protein